MQRRCVPVQALTDFAAQVLAAAGMEASESRVVARHLGAASLRGVDSHGMTRLPVYAQRVRAGGIRSPVELTVVRDHSAVVVLDGGHGAGQVVGERAMDTAVERAHRFGLGAVAVRHGNHLGALAAYTVRAAEDGVIGIVATNASPRMAPTGGAEPLLGNNPWSVAVPGEGQPVVVDMATSVAALGKVRQLKERGEPMPAGWARDLDGRPTTDPAAAIDGLLEPIGGHKGYGIALVVDLLTGALAGSSTGPDVGVLTDAGRVGDQGHLFLALATEAFGPAEEYRRRVGAIAERLRASRTAPGVDAVRVPGDPEQSVQAQRTAEGIPLSDALATRLRDTAAECGVHVPAWLTEA